MNSKTRLLRYLGKCRDASRVNPELALVKAGEALSVYIGDDIAEAYKRIHAGPRKGHSPSRS